MKLFSVILLVFVCMGCKTKAFSSTPTTTIVTHQKNEVSYENINNTDFTTFSTKATITYTSNNTSNTFSASIRIVKDSCIWVSISPALGIELARAIITEDSVMVLNRWDKVFIVEQLSFLEKFIGMPVSYTTLQAMLVGNYFELEELKPYQQEKQNPLTISALAMQDDSLLHRTIFEGNKPQMVLLSYSLNNLVIGYQEWENVQQQKIPTAITMESQGEHAIRANLNYSKMKLNEPVEVNFIIPSHYKKMEN